MRGSPPLRFLAILLGGWAALRTALLAPPWPAPPGAAVAAAAASRARAAPCAEIRDAMSLEAEGTRASDRSKYATATGAPSRAGEGRAQPVPAQILLAPQPAIRSPEAAAVAARASPPPAPPGALPTKPGPASASSRRWSLSAWSFVRPGEGAALATGGVLGGSQAGARLAWRLNGDLARPLALSLRLSAPLRRGAGAEAALGVDWRPARSAPVHLLAERRQALGGQGRSAFAVTLYGGVGDARLGPFRIDAYAQAGMVGTRSRDPFADGSLRLSIPLGGGARIGAGAWAAAQPDLSRLDLGPQAAVRLPVAGRAFTLAADWRVRVAGNARPGSGPTLTVATDF